MIYSNVIEQELISGVFFEKWHKGTPQEQKDYQLLVNTKIIQFNSVPYNILKKVNWEKKDLTNADLTRTNLSHLNLSKTNLQGADLRFAELQGAHLKEANLEDTCLFSAKLSNNYSLPSNFEDNMLLELYKLRG